MRTHLIRLPSPIGRIELTATGGAVTSLHIESDGTLPHDGFLDDPDEVLLNAAAQLGEYFAGTRREFRLPLAPAGTPFRLSVWNRLAEVGWGEQITYGELGAAIGNPAAGRAIGSAVGANPLPLLIGCHRVLGSAGRMTGYSAGSGIATKLWLLEHEGILLAA